MRLRWGCWYKENTTRRHTNSTPPMRTPRGRPSGRCTEEVGEGKRKNADEEVDGILLLLEIVRRCLLFIHLTP